jgi:hypothetical protein
VKESPNDFVQRENDLNRRPGLTKRGNPFITKVLKQFNIPKFDFNPLIRKAKSKRRSGRCSGNLAGKLPFHGQALLGIFN